MTSPSKLEIFRRSGQRVAPKAPRQRCRIGHGDSIVSPSFPQPDEDAEDSRCADFDQPSGSDVVLAASVPSAISVFGLSLRDEAGFAPMTAMFGRFVCTAAAIIAVWGLRAWWVQRVSAIYMRLLIVFLLASLGLQPMHTYARWRAWLTRPAESLLPSSDTGAAPHRLITTE